ncbi:unnamed protein product [Ectocarpus fasciculatus]
MCLMHTHARSQARRDSTHRTCKHRRSNGGRRARWRQQDAAAKFSLQCPALPQATCIDRREVKTRAADNTKWCWTPSIHQYTRPCNTTLPLLTLNIIAGGLDFLPRGRVEMLSGCSSVNKREALDGRTTAWDAVSGSKSGASHPPPKKKTKTLTST